MIGYHKTSIDELEQDDPIRLRFQKALDNKRANSLDSQKIEDEKTEEIPQEETQDIKNDTHYTKYTRGRNSSGCKHTLKFGYGENQRVMEIMGDNAHKPTSAYNFRFSSTLQVTSKST